MATYASNYVITVDLYRNTEGADRHAEDMVRGALSAASDIHAPDEHPEGGETVIGWLAEIPGRTTPGDGSATRFVVWQPGADVPHGATTLHCKGRRTV
jgi:hypothetical protein